MKTNFEKTNLFSCPIYKIRIDPISRQGPTKESRMTISANITVKEEV